jgi:hypothetical protein
MRRFKGLRPAGGGRFRFASAVYLRPDFGDEDLGGFELCRPPTNMPPNRANDSMAWFIFDTFMAASPR